MKLLGDKYGRKQVHIAGIEVLGYPPTWDADSKDLELVWSHLQQQQQKG